MKLGRSMIPCRTLEFEGGQKLNDKRRVVTIRCPVASGGMQSSTMRFLYLPNLRDQNTHLFLTSSHGRRFRIP